MAPSTDNLETVKLVLIGNTNVGKTSLITRYSAGEFKAQTFATVGSDFSTKEYPNKRPPYTVNLWDTSGSTQQAILIKPFIQANDTDVIGICLGPSNDTAAAVNSFTDTPAKNLIRLINLTCLNTKAKAVFILTKIELYQDKLDSVKETLRSALKTTHEIDNPEIYSCSAKTDKDVFKTFNAIEQTALQNKRKNQAKPKQQTRSFWRFFCCCKSANDDEPTPKSRLLHRN